MDERFIMDEKMIKEYSKITHEEAMKLSKQDFIERCKVWITIFNDDKLLSIDEGIDCPLHNWVKTNQASCGHNIVANTMNCEICGKPCCPDCYNHDVTQISRVTGYMSDVSGWNAGKVQEFKDRQRHIISSFG